MTVIGYARSHTKALRYIATLQRLFPPLAISNENYQVYSTLNEQSNQPDDEYFMGITCP